MVPRVLTIAGSDSGGGAGIQADLKVMTSHSVYGLSVITAITSQNTLKVDAVEVVDADMVEAQFRSVMTDIGCHVAKLGMLGNRENVVRLAALLQEFQITQNVIDPVMVATTGARLLTQDAIESFIRDLLPQAFILTPNIQEARLLIAESRSIDIADVPNVTGLDSLLAMARQIQALGPAFVLVKGGHAPLNDQWQVSRDIDSRLFVADVLVGKNLTKVFTSTWSPSRNTHGTGCTLASSIACHLAQRKPVVEAVEEAIGYVHGAIINAFDIGTGSGPLNHMHRIQALPFNSGGFVDYLIAHPAINPAWKAYTEHSFVRQLADGSLPRPAFERFLRQDYLYLVQYARLTALAGYKSDTLEDITASAEIILHIREELDLHIKYCEEFGISKSDLEQGRESVACTVYTRYIEGIGNSRDWLSLQVALAACLIGYGEVGKRLSESKYTNKNSIYWPWICNYVEDDYSAAVNTGRKLIEKHAGLQSPAKIAEFVEIFRRVTEYEALFWTEALTTTEHQP